MKKILIILILGLTTNLYSQSLTLDELISLRKKNVVEVEEYLSAKGWRLFSAEKETETNLAVAEFRFVDSSGSILLSRLFYYSNISGTKRISVSFNNQVQYNAYMNKIKGFGCKLLKSEFEDGRMIKIYQGATIVFRIDLYPKNDEETGAASFLIYDKLDYLWVDFDSYYLKH